MSALIDHRRDHEQFEGREVAFFIRADGLRGAIYEWPDDLITLGLDICEAEVGEQGGAWRDASVREFIDWEPEVRSTVTATEGDQYPHNAFALQLVAVGDPDGHVRRKWRRPDGTFLTRSEGEQYLRLVSGGKKPAVSRLRRVADALRVLATLGGPADDR